MHCKLGSTILGLTIILLGARSILGIPIPALNLAEMVRNADLIAVGQVATIQELERTSIDVQGQALPARRMVGTLRVYRTVKGRSAGSIIAMEFFVPETFLGYTRISASQFGMFFLRRTAAGYVVLNPYYPFVVASTKAPDVRGSDLDRVTAEVGQVVIVPGSPAEERRRAIEVLATVKTSLAMETLRAAAQDPDATVRLKATAALLRQNDLSTLGSVQELLISPPEDIEAKLVRDLAFAIKDGVKSQESVPVLARLLRSRNVYVRRAAAAGLRHTEADAAIEPLSVALADADREVRYHAVLGLAAIAGQGEWGPPIGEFERDEQRYLVYWREWVKKNR